MRTDVHMKKEARSQIKRIDCIYHTVKTIKGGHSWINKFATLETASTSWVSLWPSCYILIYP